MSTIRHPVSRTARLTAAARAREAQRPNPLFIDPFAETLAGAEGFELMDRLEKAARPPGWTGPPENPYIVIRTRFIDDFITAALSSSPVRQVVLVAAGLDTRPFRLAMPEGTRWFELDRPEVLQFKQLVLDDLGAGPRCERLTIAVDLETAGWTSQLVAAGLAPNDPTLWVVEGLLPYLDERAVNVLLASIQGLAAAGSRLVTDVPGKSFLESPWVQSMLEVMARENAPWKFGTDEPEALLAAHGWRATARRPGEEGVSWDRWPFPVPPRGATQFPQSYIVTAERA